MPDQHVPTGTRDAGPGEGLGIEDRWQPVEEPPEFLETLEHRGIAGGIGIPAFDHVTAVLPMDTGRPEEGSPLGETVGNVVAQRRGDVSGQFVGNTVDRYPNSPTSRLHIDSLFAMRELDQEPRDSVS